MEKVTPILLYKRNTDDPKYQIIKFIMIDRHFEFETGLYHKAYNDYDDMIRATIEDMKCSEKYTRETIEYDISRYDILCVDCTNNNCYIDTPVLLRH